ncbi:MAG: hypothetical protein WBA09_22180 [Candidatus Acidiferrum sp.]
MKQQTNWYGIGFERHFEREVTAMDARAEFEKWKKRYQKKFLFAPKHFDTWQAGVQAAREQMLRECAEAIQGTIDNYALIQADGTRTIAFNLVIEDLWAILSKFSPSQPAPVITSVEQLAREGAIEAATAMAEPQGLTKEERRCQICGRGLPRSWSFSVCQGECTETANKLSRLRAALKDLIVMHDNRHFVTGAQANERVDKARAALAARQPAAKGDASPVLDLMRLPLEQTGTMDNLMDNIGQLIAMRDDPNGEPQLLVDDEGIRKLIENYVAQRGDGR